MFIFYLVHQVFSDVFDASIDTCETIFHFDLFSRYKSRILSVDSYKKIVETKHGYLRNSFGKILLTFCNVRWTLQFVPNVIPKMIFRLILLQAMPYDIRLSVIEKRTTKFLQILEKLAVQRTPMSRSSFASRLFHGETKLNQRNLTENRS